MAIKGIHSPTRVSDEVEIERVRILANFWSYTINQILSGVRYTKQHITHCTDWLLIQFVDLARQELLLYTSVDFKSSH